jgi:hypothetical protein
MWFLAAEEDAFEVDGAGGEVSQDHFKNLFTEGTGSPLTWYLSHIQLIRMEKLA